MKKVMVTGTFDIFHPGHRDFFRQAKKQGDKLVVLVARDSTVKAVKGEKPLNSEAKRVKAIKSCNLVDKVVLGDPEDKYKMIEEEKPDILCLGYDQVAFTEKLEETLLKRGLNTQIIRLEPFMPEIYKSSKIKKLKNRGSS